MLESLSSIHELMIGDSPKECLLYRSMTRLTHLTRLSLTFKTQDPDQLSYDQICSFISYSETLKSLEFISAWRTVPVNLEPLSNAIKSSRSLDHLRFSARAVHGADSFLQMLSTCRLLKLEFEVNEENTGLLSLILGSLATSKECLSCRLSLGLANTIEGYFAHTRHLDLLHSLSTIEQTCTAASHIPDRPTIL